MTPIELIWWAVAVLVVVFVAFLILVIVVAALRTLRAPKSKDTNILGGPHDGR